MKELAYVNNSLGQEAVLVEKDGQYAVVVSLTSGEMKKCTSVDEAEAWRFWEEIKEVIEEHDLKERTLFLE
jgi:hypothetical protein